MSFNPLLSLARNAKRQKMDMQCDPQWVLDLAAERDQLREERDSLESECSRVTGQNARLHDQIVELYQDRDQLRAELIKANDRYQRDVYGLNNEGDPIGGEPPGGYANDNAKLRAELAAIRGQEPVAFAVFADNGNIRIWSANSSAIRAELIAQDLTITDLYALPPQQPDAVSVPRELLERVATGMHDTAFLMSTAKHQFSGSAACRFILENGERELRAALSTRQAEEGEPCAK